MKRFLLAALLLLCQSGAQAALKVVTTTPAMAALARAVGGEHVQVSTLVGNDRDAHMLQVKPSMMRAVRDADLVVAVGADLEAGWLPEVLASAGNPRVQTGRPGHFEAAMQVERLPDPPSSGFSAHLHRYGNPHINLDPLRMAQAGEALARTLAGLDTAHADDFHRQAAAFRAAVEARLPVWRESLKGAQGAVLYHRDAVYLLDRFGLKLLGTLEPVPGVPPTANHLRELAAQLQGQKGVIVQAPWHAPDGPRQLSELTGLPIRILPLDPPADADGQAYLRLIDAWVEALAAGGTP